MLTVPANLTLAESSQDMVDVLVTASADDSLSGVDWFQISVKDEYGRVEPFIGSQLQRQIQLEAWRDGHDRDGRVYTVSITVTVVSAVALFPAASVAVMLTV